MNNPYVRFVVFACVGIVIIIGLSRMVTWLQSDSLRATEELRNNVNKK